MSDDDINDQELNLSDDLRAEADSVLAEVDSPRSASEDAENGTEIPDVPLDEAIHGLLDITFNGLLKFRGEHWAIPNDQLVMVSKSYAAVLLKYWPDLNFGVELTAIVITVSVFGPRLAIDKALSDKAKAAAADDEPDDGVESRAESTGDTTGQPKAEPDADA